MKVLDYILFLFCLMIYAFYLGYGEKCVSELGIVYRVKGDIRILSQSVEEYKLRMGVLPNRLEDLIDDHIKVLHSDPWDQNYHYKKQNNIFWLFTLGSDNKVGGSGSATDMSKETDFDKLIEYIKEPVFGCNF